MIVGKLTFIIGVPPPGINRWQEAETNLYKTSNVGDKKLIRNPNTQATFRAAFTIVDTYCLLTELNKFKAQNK